MPSYSEVFTGRSCAFLNSLVERVLLKRDRANPPQCEPLLGTRAPRRKLACFCKDLVASREAKKNLANFLVAGAWSQFVIGGL